MGITRYNHHGKDVWVHTNDTGHHKEHCLCYKCLRYNPDNRPHLKHMEKPTDELKKAEHIRSILHHAGYLIPKEHQCPIADILYTHCIDFYLVIPVWECPVGTFIPKPGEEDG